MAEEVKKVEEKAKEAVVAVGRWLKNTVTGVHFPHTDILALRGDLKECDAKGNLIAPPALHKSDAPKV